MLASAPISASSDSNVELILISAGVVMVIALLGWLPIQLARIRQHRHRETILAIILLWGLLSAASISYDIMQQMNWTTELQQRIESGYYDPSDSTGKRNPPIVLWCGLGVIYVGMIIWANRSPRGS